ncbi:MAG TPA: hypothetical protein ENN79_12845 [Desulfobacteraceae bacterium]|nr:hypothetical protein [Desulfobacteraceae bacterium]
MTCLTETILEKTVLDWFESSGSQTASDPDGNGGRTTIGGYPYGGFGGRWGSFKRHDDETTGLAAALVFGQPTIR